MRRTDKEKRCLEVRNEQLKAEKERLLYDVQLPGRHLADDARSAIARGLHAKTGQLNTSSQPANPSEAGWSEPGAPASDSAPPSFPPGPPSSSAPTEPSSAEHRALVPLGRARSHTEADRQQGIAARLVTDQKLAPPLVEISHQRSASSAEMAARPTKRKPAHLGKSRAENLARRVTKAGVKHKRYVLKVPPLTWEEADRRHYERMASKLDAERMVYAILDNYRGRVGNSRAAPCAEAPAAPSTPQIEAETISAQALQAATETISTQAQAAAAALAAMANGGARGQGATALV